MKLTLIGDIHCGYKQLYFPILEDIVGPSIQIGDMGHGMFLEKERMLPEVAKQHKFIRGNHDNPELCAKHPNYLGDFGYIDKWDLFYIGGAATPKWALGNFTLGISWWPDEELNLKECNKALDLYEQSKPRIVISHDCPNIAGIDMMSSRGRTFDGSSTSSLLQAMYDIHQPSQWYFGHYHQSRKFKIHKTFFRCLEEAEVLEITV